MFRYLLTIIFSPNIKPVLVSGFFLIILGLCHRGRQGSIKFCLSNKVPIFFSTSQFLLDTVVRMCCIWIKYFPPFKLKWIFVCRKFSDCCYWVICCTLVPLEWRLIAYNLKSICPKSSTLDKCRATRQLQNTIMFSPTGIYWYCTMLARRAGVEKMGRITVICFHSGWMKEVWRKKEWVLWTVYLLERIKTQYSAQTPHVQSSPPNC